MSDIKLKSDNKSEKQAKDRMFELEKQAKKELEEIGYYDKAYAALGVALFGNKEKDNARSKKD